MSPSDNIAFLKQDEHPILSDTDQLNQILNVLGTPSKSDYCFIPKKSHAYEYLKHNTKGRTFRRVNFSQQYPGATRHAIDLLKKLLKFNPAFRPTAKEAMEHPFFDMFRKREHF